MIITKKYNENCCSRVTPSRPRHMLYWYYSFGLGRRENQSRRRRWNRPTWRYPKNVEPRPSDVRRRRQAIIRHACRLKRVHTEREWQNGRSRQNAVGTPYVINLSKQTYDFHWIEKTPVSTDANYTRRTLRTVRVVITFSKYMTRVYDAILTQCKLVFFF